VDQVDPGTIELEIAGRAGVVSVVLVDDFGVVFAQHLKNGRLSLSRIYACVSAVYSVEIVDNNNGDVTPSTRKLWRLLKFYCF